MSSRDDDRQDTFICDSCCLCVVRNGNEAAFAHCVVRAKDEDDAYSIGQRQEEAGRLIGQVDSTVPLNDYVLPLGALSALCVE
jgi:hypothetical protein